MNILQIGWLTDTPFKFFSPFLLHSHPSWISLVFHFFQGEKGDRGDRVLCKKLQNFFLPLLWCFKFSAVMVSFFVWLHRVREAEMVQTDVRESLWVIHSLWTCYSFIQKCTNVQNDTDCAYYILYCTILYFCVCDQGRDGLPGREGPRGPEGPPGQPGQIKPIDPSGGVKGEKGERVSRFRDVQKIQEPALLGIKVQMGCSLFRVFLALMEVQGCQDDQVLQEMQGSRWVEGPQTTGHLYVVELA